MTQSSLWLRFVFVFALGCSLFSCTQKRSNEYGLDIRETLRVNIQTEPPTLDHNKASDSVSGWILLNTLEGLINFDYSTPDMKAIPALAESWEASDKNKVWTFKIRKGVKWTDGVELKAQHFVDSWERLLNAKTASDYSSYLFPIKNAQGYFDGKVKDFADVGVKAKDDYTLVVTLKAPMSFFPTLFFYRTTYPLRKDVLEKYGNSAFTDPTKFVGLGPYKLKTWDHDKAIVLERNEDYYGEKPKIKYILCYMIIEGSTAVNLFDSGKLDFLPEFPATDMAKQKTRPEYKASPALVTQFYGINTKKRPMDNPWFRKAVAAAINHQELVEMLAAGQNPTTSWIPKGMLGYEPERGIKFDPARAREYLAQAGYSESKKPPRLIIGFNSGDDIKRMAENIQAQLKRNLGIDVELQGEEWKVFLNKLKADPPHLWRFAWGADYPDPDNFFGMFTSYSANNNTRWKSKVYDDLVDKGMGEPDQSKRLQMYSHAQKILLEEDVAIIPLYNSVRSKLINPRVENYPINPLDMHDYRKTSLKQ